MTPSPIFVCPGTEGYIFSPSELKADARLLFLLQPSSTEIQEDGPLVPIVRADWLKPGWFLRQKVVALVGLRATVLKSAVQRGGGSVWAVASVFSVIGTPTCDSLLPTLSQLADSFRHAILDSPKEGGFANLTHLDLVAWADKSKLDLALTRLDHRAQSGPSNGPFRGSSRIANGRNTEA